MQILIPAAGMGKRLGLETSDKTKAMVKVNGRTLIERCLDAAVEHPIDRILMVVGYQKDKLKGKSNSPILIEAQCVTMPCKSKLSKMEKRKT